MATQLSFLLCLVISDGRQEATTTLLLAKIGREYEPPGGNVDQREVAVGGGQPLLHGGAGHPAGQHPQQLHQADPHPDLGGGGAAGRH